MDHTPISDALALRATASAFDAQRGKLPVPEDPHRSPDTVAVARQISELGKLITDLGDEVLFRTADQDQTPHTARVITNFAAAIEPAGEAASALGAVAHRPVSECGCPEHNGGTSGWLVRDSVRASAAHIPLVALRVGQPLAE